MTTNIRVDDFDVESHKRSITPAAIVSLIARTALDDNDIPDEVLDNLIGRFQMRDG